LSPAPEVSLNIPRLAQSGSQKTVTVAEQPRWHSAALLTPIRPQHAVKRTGRGLVLRPKRRVYGIEDLRVGDGAIRK
jgi:hypothetical protein